MIGFTTKKKGSLGKNYLYRCTAFGLRRRAIFFFNPIEKNIGDDNAGMLHFHTRKIGH